MAKSRRDRSISFERPRKPSVPCTSSLTHESNPKYPPPSENDLKEWEEARCPVCMEHPHNAVLLVCSSFHKGCRPYMCDTSYRHSNCLDQFRKSFVEDTTEEVPSQEGNIEHWETIINMHKIQQKLVCPLCRGRVSGWVVVDPAREFMNGKKRSCASESCKYNGNYTDLRKHARSEHPRVRPSEADPERERSWRQLERQRDIGDVLSTIQSSLGDDQDDDDDLLFDEQNWITFFFLFRIWQPSSSSRRSRRSGPFRTRTRPNSGHRRLDRHWGESYNVDRASNSIEVNDSSEDGLRRPYTRRRLSTPDDEV